MKTERRSVLKKLFAAIIGAAGGSLAARAESGDGIVKATPEVINFQDQPLFSPFTRHGNLVFVSGHGKRLEGDIKAHTDNVLKMIEAQLIRAGSSMEKVLKVTVFLETMDDYNGMNEVYKGRFGKNPPARTTVAVPNGLPPADHLIQMDCIAYI